VFFFAMQSRSAVLLNAWCAFGRQTAMLATHFIFPRA